ncbi:hypothetical protein Tsp_01742 [Trichinella spiralis]|uniref:hypothetical protein n=1 Tax=Trichinella spiralis TaxID=6334 RepID=UPI0001EFCA7F|nr:hypothetical protein Tsp_01742 [Trichinella spiralis]
MWQNADRIDCCPSIALAFAVDTEIFDLVHWNRLVIGNVVGRLVMFGIGAKCANVHFARAQCPARIDHHGHERFLVHLVQHLRVDINAGKPASVSGMAVIPSDHVFHTPEHIFSIQIAHHVFVSLFVGVDPGFGPFDRQRERIQNYKRVRHRLAKQQTHHLDTIARLRVIGNFHQSQRRHLHTLEIMGIFFPRAST